MKSIFIIFWTIIIFTMIFGCKARRSSQIKDNQIHEQIEKFVNSIDSNPRSRELQNVIMVDFFKANDSLLFTIRTGYYYPVNTNYYFFIKDYMIAFNNTNLNPYDDWIKNLKKEPIPSKFRNESEIHKRPFEPWIIKYQIISRDSIKLISNIRY